MARIKPELRNPNRWQMVKMRSGCARPRAQQHSPTERLHNFLRFLRHVAVAGDGHTPSKLKSHFGVRVKPELRNPSFRNPKEDRNPKAETSHRRLLEKVCLPRKPQQEFPASDFGFLSDLGFRASEFGLKQCNPCQSSFQIRVYSWFKNFPPVRLTHLPAICYRARS